jgi:MFS family permease
MVFFSCALAGLGVLGHHIGQFYATCLVIGAVGNISQIGFAHAISSWFHEFRGRAMGLVLAGDGMGLMIFPVIAQSMIGHSGWRAGYVLLGSLTLLIGLPLAILYGRSREEHVVTATVSEPSGVTWQKGLLSYSFWIIVTVLFLSSMSVNGAVTHQVPLLTDHGMPARSAAFTISVLGGANVVGRLGTGWLLDRFPGPRVGFVLLLLASFGMILLAHATSFALGCTAALLLGLGAGGISNTTPYLLTRYFGLRSFSTLYGLTFTFYAIAGGAGPVLMGRVFDRTGSYTSTLTVFGGLTVVGAILMLLLPRYRIPETGEQA